MQLLADALHPTAPILPAVVPPPMPGTGTRGVSRWELQGPGPNGWGWQRAKSAV